MLEEFKANILAVWKDMDQRKRTGFVLASVAVTVLVIVLAIWLMKTSYEVLFSDLDERDAASIVAELRQLKVPYQIDDSGHKILVPDKQVHETRLKLMGKGVMLNGGVGFEIFDNKDLGMTEYTQKINYQRALQGELARTIMAGESIKLARVHLVLPEASIFKREKVKPKASISLVLRPGGALDEQQILGIQRLVAASVPGMESSAVTVTDQRGVTLSSLTDGEDGLAGSSGKLRVKREVENYISHKINEVMDRTYGVGQAIVSVDVTLNFDEIHRTDQEVMPITSPAGEATGVLIRKRQSLYRQDREGAAKAVEGADTASPGSNLNSTSEVEYEVSRRVQQVVTAPGGIKRISVGVVLPKTLASDQLENVRQMVTMAAGLSQERGDAIVVHGIDQLLERDVKAPPGPAQSADLTTENGSNLAGLSNLISSMPKWRLLVAFGLLVAVVGSLSGVIFMKLMARSRLRPHADLDSDQRRMLLSEIQQWIDAEKTATQGVTKS